jgi:hypothetical protein
MRAFRICLLFLLLTGCQEITYREPQPKGVKSLADIPESMRGRYLLPEDNRAMRDTLVVEANTYYATSDKGDKRVLGDSLLLRFYKGYYFLSLYNNPEWLSRVVRLEPNGDIAYYMLGAEEKNFPTFVRQLTEQIKIDSSVVGDKKLYQIDPSPQQLLALIKKGYFRQTAILKKLPDMASQNSDTGGLL